MGAPPSKHMGRVLTGLGIFTRLAGMCFCMRSSAASQDEVVDCRHDMVCHNAPCAWSLCVNACASVLMHIVMRHAPPTLVIACNMNVGMLRSSHVRMPSRGLGTHGEGHSPLCHPARPSRRNRTWCINASVLSAGKCCRPSICLNRGELVVNTAVRLERYLGTYIEHHAACPVLAGDPGHTEACSSAHPWVVVKEHFQMRDGWAYCGELVCRYAIGLQELLQPCRYVWEEGCAL